MALTQVSRGLLSTSIVDNGNATAITIDSSENVTFSGTVTADGLTVDGGTSNQPALIKSTDATVKLGFQDDTTTNTYSVTVGAVGDAMIFSSGSGGAERMRIDSSGNVMIGTTLSGSSVLTAAKFTDGSESAPHFRIHGSSSTYTGYHWLDATAYYIGQNSSSRKVRIYSGAETSGVNLTAGGTSWGTFSDERLKYDVEPVENALESLSELRTVKYRLRNVDEPDSQKKIGVVAQDLVGVLDEVIDPLQITGDDTEYMAVRYTELVPVLIKAIQEQQQTITALEARITQLENN